MVQRPRLWSWFVLVLVLAGNGLGCAHRRHVFYPSDHASRPANGVRVRAPFVDVNVQGSPDDDDLDDD